MKRHINKTIFRAEAEMILRGGISSEYTALIIDKFLDDIKADVEETSAWNDEGYYNNDDIRLSIGRVLTDYIYKCDNGG